MTNTQPTKNKLNKKYTTPDFSFLLKQYLKNYSQEHTASNYKYEEVEYEALLKILSSKIEEELNSIEEEKNKKKALVKLGTSIKEYIITQVKALINIETLKVKYIYTISDKDLNFDVSSDHLKLGGLEVEII